MGHFLYYRPNSCRQFEIMTLDGKCKLIQICRWKYTLRSIVIRQYQSKIAVGLSAESGEHVDVIGSSVLWLVLLMLQNKFKLQMSEEKEIRRKLDLRQNNAYFNLRISLGTSSWLVAQFRYCAPIRKVAGLIPNCVIEFFYWHNPSGRSMALGLTQPLTEMSTRNISWGLKAAGA
jgi:hypothetical protein